MRKLHLALIGLLLLAVMLSGCADKQPNEERQTTQGPTLEGNITVPGGERSSDRGTAGKPG